MYTINITNENIYRLKTDLTVFSRNEFKKYIKTTTKKIKLPLRLWTYKKYYTLYKENDCYYLIIDNRLMYSLKDFKCFFKHMVYVIRKCLSGKLTNESFIKFPMLQTYFGLSRPVIEFYLIGIGSKDENITLYIEEPSIIRL